MAEPMPQGWEEPEAPVDAPAVPPGWIAPAAPAPAAVAPAEAELPTFHRRRRFWITTLVYVALFALMAVTVDTGGQPWFLLVPLVPLWALTLPFVLRKPRRLRQA